MSLRTSLKSVLGSMLIIAATVSHAQIVRNGELPQNPPFPRSNWWNVDISKAPVDASSSSIINFIGPTDGMHPDFGGDSGETAPDPLIYGMIYIVVPGTQPLVPVTYTLYGNQSDAGAPGRPAGFPIPEEAKTQDRWLEGGVPANDPDSYGDRHMIIVDRDNLFLYELWATEFNVAQNRWEAGSGAVFRLDRNTRRPEEWTSADAAGLAILPGLVRYDETFSGAPIRHAFRFTTRATNGYVFPASHEAGDTVGAPPMGTRLRLKSSVNISGFTPEVQRIFQAMKTYGLILADNGSDMYVQGVYDTRWDNGILNPAFSAIKASDFEVIQLGWIPSHTSTNDDNKADVVFRDASSGQNAIWLLDGASITGGAYLPTIPTTMSIVGNGDFDGDGRADLLWRNSTTGENAIWFMEGSSIKSGAYLPTAASSFIVGGVGDFDGDGRADIFWRNPSTGANAMWMMDGATIKSGQLVADAAAGFSVAGVADFDGNGTSDVLWRNLSSGANAMWLMDGATITSGKVLPTMGDTLTVIGVGDVNGSATADILWRTHVGTHVIWLMEGTTMVDGVFPPFASTEYTAAAVADFDGDHLVDILWRDSAGNTAIWFLDADGFREGASLSPSPASMTIVSPQ